MKQKRIRFTLSDRQYNDLIQGKYNKYLFGKDKTTNKTPTELIKKLLEYTLQPLRQEQKITNITITTEKRPVAKTTIFYITITYY